MSSTDLRTHSDDVGAADESESEAKLAETTACHSRPEDSNARNSRKDALWGGCKKLWVSAMNFGSPIFKQAQTADPTDSVLRPGDESVDDLWQHRLELNMATKDTLWGGCKKLAKRAASNAISDAICAI